MGTNSVSGQLGQAPLQLSTDDGVLRLDGREIILMRVKMIARLFADLTDRPFFSGLVHDAGRLMGADYATDWLLMKTPVMHAGFALPPELARRGAEYEQLEDQIDRGATDAAVLRAETQLTAEIKQLLSKWLPTLPDAAVQSAWEQMLALDVYGGWGKARLLEFRRSEPYARIEVTASFAARPAHVWSQHGVSDRKVCHLLAGYLEGEARLLLAREDLVGKEQHCRLEGGDRCYFVIQPESLLGK
jgi:V4R domain-containing protein